MFIIFGSPRSGTTLLSTILDTNENMVIPDESDFIIPTAFVFNRVKDEEVGKKLIENIIVSTKRFKTSIGEYLTESDVRNTIRESEYNLYSIFSNLYKLIARKQGAKLAGDKSPNDLLYSRILVESGLFQSDLKIIHIVRDIRDVLLSLKKVKWDVDWKSTIDSFFPRFWSDSNLYLHNLLKDSPEQYFFVKYEDMIVNPTDVFKNLTGFLGVPFYEYMLDPSRRNQRYNDCSHHQNINKPILQENIQLWENEMDQSTIDVCKTQASEAMKQFGYL